MKPDSEMDLFSFLYGKETNLLLLRRRMGENNSFRKCDPLEHKLLIQAHNLSYETERLNEFATVMWLAE